VAKFLWFGVANRIFRVVFILGVVILSDNFLNFYWGEINHPETIPKKIIVFLQSVGYWWLLKK